MAEKDYYKTLGVSRDASAEEIRKAYRRLAKKYHPDRHKGDKSAEEKFKAVSEAYHTLKDKKKRAQYDRLREAEKHGGFTGFEDFFAGRAKPSAGPSGFGFGGAGGMGDLIDRIFGRDARTRTEAGFAQPARGGDIKTSIKIPFEMAFHGGKVDVRVPRRQKCRRCDGTGAAPGSRADACPQCGGKGQVLTGLGGFSVSRACPQCLGRGKIIRRPCTVCNGTGMAEQTTRVEVRIPKGIESGKKLRLAGMGQEGAQGGPPGDLTIEVQVAAPPGFERKGLNTYGDLTIDMVEAALGAEKDVKTLKGIVSLKIPAGTQPGQKLRIAGQGMEGAQGQKGDHFVTVKVRIPKDLTPRQQELLKELRRTEAAANRRT